MKLEYIITSHVNSNLSGVAKFNRLLAKRLKIACVEINDICSLKKGPVLFSVKLRDCSHVELKQIHKALGYLVSRKIVYDIFLHTFDEPEIEYELIKYCRHIFSANAEINHQTHRIGKKIISVWCPSTIDANSIIYESRFNIFSFGMAHKIQIKYYQKLHQLLKASKINYTIWLSTAFHEKANFGDFNIIKEQLSKIFNRHIQFLGFISDDAVNYFLDKSQLFVAFFKKGIRANNTTVYTAMSRGCAILTNCDKYSPSWMQHSKNVLNLHKIQLEDLDITRLKEIGTAAKKAVNKHTDWEKLINLINETR